MLAWLILTGVLCLLLGIALTLAVQRALFLPAVDDKLLMTPVESVTAAPIQTERPVNPLGLPQELAETLTTDKKSAEPAERDETLLAINLLMEFFFREAQSNGPVRRFLIRRINKEMRRGIETGGTAVNKIIKGLKIYDVEMGSEAPSISKVDVISVTMDGDGKLVESVDVGVHLEYSGGFAIGIDVALAYGKTALLSAKVSQLSGILRMKFSRQPYSHWTVAFCPPPAMEVAISSRIQGQSYGIVTDLLASLIEGWINVQHSVPNTKMSTHPIFPDPDRQMLKPAPTPLPTIRKGRLLVTVDSVSRLDPSLFQAEGVFCILALDSSPWIDFAPSETVGHVLLDIRMIRKRDRPLGFVFHGLPAESADYSVIDEIVGNVADVNPAGVVIISTEPGSCADEAGFRAGDVILEVDGKPISSIRHVLRAVASATANYVIVRVDRFIPAVKTKVEQCGPKPFTSFERSKQCSLYPLPDDLDASHRETIGRMVGLEMGRTETYPMGKEVRLGDNVDFRLLPGQRFLNLSVWLTGVRSDEFSTTSASAASISVEKPRFSLSRLFKLKKDLPDEHEQTTTTTPATEESLKEARLGYVNVSLAEIAADCHLNTSGHHISTYQLYPADLKASLGRKHPLADQPGFDARLCYGDITLSFVHQPDEEMHEPLETQQTAAAALQRGDQQEEEEAQRSAEQQQAESPAERDRSQVDAVIYELKRPHDWTLKQFGQLRNCDVCQSKIWLGEGLYCPRCGLLIHKKCFKRILGEPRKWCSVNQSIAKIDDYYISNVPVPAEGVKSDLEGDPFDVDEENEEMAELDLLVERLQARNHNEALVRLAKDSGKKLFSHLDAVKRRNKISSMLSKIEDAVRVETIRRYELAAEWERATLDPSMGNGVGNSKWIEVELAASERKRQALILLQLYFTVGWQDAEDNLEQQTT